MKTRFPARETQRRGPKPRPPRFGALASARWATGATRMARRRAYPAPGRAARRLGPEGAAPHRSGVDCIPPARPPSSPNPPCPVNAAPARRCGLSRDGVTTSPAAGGGGRRRSIGGLGAVARRRRAAIRACPRDAATPSRYSPHPRDLATAAGGGGRESGPAAVRRRAPACASSSGGRARQSPRALCAGGAAVRVWDTGKGDSGKGVWWVGGGGREQSR